MNIDIDKTKQKIQKMAKEEKKPPKLAMFGGSLFLFPHPVRELVEDCIAWGKVAYDAAHVAGLIAGGHFQDPLREGADAVSLEHSQDALRPSRRSGHLIRKIR